MNLNINALLHPDNAFSPFPFWFLNGDLTEEKLDTQLHDFARKGIFGVVLHPRIGLSREVGYLTPRYFALIRHAVKTCAALGIRVLLYDEGMYPSGSAHGAVVRENADYAAKGIWAGEAGKTGVLYKTFAVTRNENGAISSARALSENEAFSGERMRLYTGFTGGTIRGVHEGEDDGEAGAPKAADLLNAEAMRAFIRHTHEKYFAEVGDEFGKTIIGFFTDEPSPVGRNAPRGVLPWSAGFEEDLRAQGFSEEMLPLLFDEGNAQSNETKTAKQCFNRALASRLRRTYYGPISAWCASHGIALCGHPHSPMDSGVLSEFGIPGQDIVWRWVAPEKDLALTGEESAQAKCASDSARHSGKKRNLNECFGCCGPEGRQWAFTVDDMKWYIDWLAARGCNLLVPHAFYYETDSSLKLDRPPDCGLNNIWWPHYKQIADYIKRLCLINTDCKNGARVAVLGVCDRLPVEKVRPLYENQIEFNYLTEDDLLHRTEWKNGKICINDYEYEALLLDEEIRYAPETRLLADKMRSEGLAVLSAFSPALLSFKTLATDTPLPDLRASLLTHENARALLLINEGEKEIRFTAALPFRGELVLFDPWYGRLYAAHAEEGTLPLTLERRGSLVILDGLDQKGLEPYEAGMEGGGRLPYASQEFDLTGQWTWTLPSGRSMQTLQNWSDLAETRLYSGEICYECTLSLPARPARALLDLGTVYEMAEIGVNGTFVGALLRPPYVSDITPYVREGENRLVVKITNSLESRYSRKPWRGGLLGRTRLIWR